MPTRRLFVESSPVAGSGVRLGPAARRHARVLRLSRGDEVELFDGRGGTWRAEVVSWDAVSLDVRVLEASGSDAGGGAESPLRLELAQGLARGGRFEEVLRAGTELGVAAFHPVVFDRSVAEPGDPAPRLERWTRVVREASRQSGRAAAPGLGSPRASREMLADPPACDLRLLLVPGAPPLGAELARVPVRPRSILACVGPEGGMAEGEQAAAARGGFVPVGLGPRVLRTEHAGPALAAVLQFLYGDLGSPGERDP